MSGNLTCLILYFFTLYLNEKREGYISFSFLQSAKNAYCKHYQNDDRQYKSEHEDPEFEESKHAAVFIHIQLAHRHTAVDDIADEYCRDERPCRKQNVRNQEVDIVEYGAAKDYAITQHTVGQCGRNSRQEYKQAE